MAKKRKQTRAHNERIAEGVALAHARRRREEEEDPTPKKRCPNCGEYKPLGVFYKQKLYDREGNPYYRPSSWCRRCIRRLQKRKRAKIARDKIRVTHKTGRS